MQTTPIKIVSLLVSALNVGLWIALFFAGLNGLKGIKEQHATGFPNQGQVMYYEILPVIMTLIGISYPVFMWSRGKENLGVGLSLIMILAILPYLLFYGGGV